MGGEIQGLDPGLLKLGKIQGLDPPLLPTVNTNSGKSRGFLISLSEARVLFGEISFLEQIERYSYVSSVQYNGCKVINTILMLCCTFLC